jgi:hypothetical protein
LEKSHDRVNRRLRGTDAQLDSFLHIKVAVLEEIAHFKSHAIFLGELFLVAQDASDEAVGRADHREAVDDLEAAAEVKILLAERVAL